MLIEKLDAPSSQVSEGALWDAESRRLYWIDAIGGVLHSYALDGARHCAWPIGGLLGAVALTDTCRLLVARGNELVEFDPGTGEATPTLFATGSGPEMQLNDGKVDRWGRFVSGELSHDRTAAGSLFRFESPGKVDQLADDIRLVNGICFSPSGDRIYFADSIRRVILTASYDYQGKQIANPDCLFDARAIDSIPDGATVDRDGNIWSAMPMTGEIITLSPTGVLLNRIKMPVEYPTSVAFGGEDLDLIFVTSIRDSGTGRAISKHPDGGCVFAVRGTGARGIAEPRFTMGHGVSL